VCPSQFQLLLLHDLCVQNDCSRKTLFLVDDLSTDNGDLLCLLVAIMLTGLRDLLKMWCNFETV
jgi:hypothetical protein